MAFLDIDAGRLTARLVPERPEAVEDGQGGAVTGFIDVARVWALIEPRGFAEAEKGPGLVSEVTHHVTIRARSDLVAGQRFRKGARCGSGWRDGRSRVDRRKTVCRLLNGTPQGAVMQRADKLFRIAERRCRQRGFVTLCGP